LNKEKLISHKSDHARFKKTLLVVFAV